MTAGLLFDFCMAMGVMPPTLYQPTYLITAGEVGVYLSIFAFVGDQPKGDRPDTKHTPHYIKIVTQNLAQADAPAEWVYSVYDTEHKLARACVDEHMLVTDGHANC